MAKSQTFNFSVDDAIVAHLIESQSGSLPKAVAELVMNAIDAGADRIEIEIADDLSFSVKDNGRGFRTKDEIFRFFGRFGAPHEKGDATFGRFRVGRGQIMALGPCQWRSGRFSMSTDFREFGVRYLFEETEDEVEGCLVQGRPYDEVWGYGVSEMEAEIRESLLYLENAALFFNKKRVNGTTHDWTLETDTFKFLHQPWRKGLRLYNMGVLVGEMSERELGVSGIVVTRKPLSLNTSRNIVIKHSCEVWREISSRVTAWRQENILSIVSSSGGVPRENRKEVLSLFFDGTLPTETFLEAKIFEDVSGNARSLRSMMSLRILHIWWSENEFSFDGIDDETLRRCNDLPGHFVFPPGFETPGRIWGESVEYGGVGRSFDPAMLFKTILVCLTEKLEDLHKGLGSRQDVGKEISWGDPDVAEIEKIESVVQWIQSLSFETEYSKIWMHVHRERSLVPDRMLSFDEIAYLRAIRSVNRRLFAIASGTTGAGQTPRKIVAGEAEPNTNAWTDGKNYIAINRTFLKMVARRKIAGVAELVDTVLHEYAHKEEKERGMVHDEEFYRSFHDMRFAHHLEPGETVGWAIYTVAVKTDKLYAEAGRRSPVRSFFREARRRVYSELGTKILLSAGENGGPKYRFPTIETQDYHAESIGKIRASSRTDIEFISAFDGNGIVLIVYHDGGKEFFSLSKTALPEHQGGSREKERELAEWAEVFLDNFSDLFGHSTETLKIYETDRGVFFITNIVAKAIRRRRKKRKERQKALLRQGNGYQP